MANDRQSRRNWAALRDLVPTLTVDEMHEANEEARSSAPRSVRREWREQIRDQENTNGQPCRRNDLEPLLAYGDKHPHRCTESGDRRGPVNDPTDDRPGLGI